MITYYTKPSSGNSRLPILNTATPAPMPDRLSFIPQLSLLRMLARLCRESRSRSRQLLTLAWSTVLLAGSGALCTGCTTISYTSPAGERFSRVALGANTTLTALEIETGTNGVRQVRLQGYQQDASEALGSVTEAAVRAAIQAK